MKTIYYISGLGADERVFKFLQLTGVKEKFIRWLTPARGERLSEYCKRLTSQVDPTDEVILVGVSFGGIVAQEIARLVKVEKIFIISSIKSPDEVDWKLALVRLLKLHLLAPARFLKWSNLLLGDYFFSTETKAESELLKQIIKDTDTTFLHWAIRQIMSWKNDHPDSNIIHIHGTNDRIFPAGKIKNATMISNGGHFMIVNRAKEVSEIIQREIITSLE